MLHDAQTTHCGVVPNKGIWSCVALWMLQFSGAMDKFRCCCLVGCNFMCLFILSAVCEFVCFVCLCVCVFVLCCPQPLCAQIVFTFRVYRLEIFICSRSGSGKVIRSLLHFWYLLQLAMWTVVFERVFLLCVAYMFRMHVLRMYFNTYSFACVIVRRWA